MNPASSEQFPEAMTAEIEIEMIGFHPDRQGHTKQHALLGEKLDSYCLAVFNDSGILVYFWHLEKP